MSGAPSAACPQCYASALSGITGTFGAPRPSQVGSILADPDALRPSVAAMLGGSTITYRNGDLDDPGVSRTRRIGEHPRADLIANVPDRRAASRAGDPGPDTECARNASGSLSNYSTAPLAITGGAVLCLPHHATNGTSITGR